MTGSTRSCTFVLFQANTSSPAPSCPEYYGRTVQDLLFKVRRYIESEDEDMLVLAQVLGSLHSIAQQSWHTVMAVKVENRRCGPRDVPGSTSQ